MADLHNATVDIDEPGAAVFCATFVMEPVPRYVCNLCGGDVDTAGGCPAGCSPLAYPGLQLADCDAQPRHPYTWFLADDGGYGAPCMYCAAAQLAAAHDPCEHSHHRPWRARKATRRLVSWAYSMGIISGSGYTHDRHCNGCVRVYWRGRRLYILGAARATWRCWLKGRHRRGEDFGAFGFCGKCVPWPCCGSTTLGHVPGCPERAS